VAGWTAPNDWVYIRKSGGGLLIAHEIGHILGLPDNTCADPHTLMCSDDPQPDIGGACSTPRQSAQGRQDAYWGP
jgi:hypothetical protein